MSNKESTAKSDTSKALPVAPSNATAGQRPVPNQQGQQDQRGQSQQNQQPVTHGSPAKTHPGNPLQQKADPLDYPGGVDSEADSEDADKKGKEAAQKAPAVSKVPPVSTPKEG